MGVHMGAFTANVVTIVISSLGLVGNILSLLVLLQENMRRLCYTYLLVGLSFSDALLLILSILRTLVALQVVPINLHDPTVSIIVFLWDWICTGGTKFYTVAISFERCFAICKPIQARRKLTRGFGKRIATGIFIFVLLLTGISLIYDKFGSFESFQIYVAVVLHFLPFSIVLCFNVCIFLGLRRYQKKRQSLNEMELSEVSVTRMLFVVVVVFGLCYSFEFIRRILTFREYFQFTDYNYHDYVINQLADIGYVLNSSVNFLIYSLLGKTFRDQFIILVKRLQCKSCPQQRPELQKSISTGSNSTTITTVH